MRLLLDESLPQQLRHHFTGHEVVTVDYMAWQGFKNGALMDVAEGAGLDALITADRGIPFQQNMTSRTISIVALAAADNQLETLLPLVPAALEALETLQTG
jgi:hypothetical protein